MLSIVKAMLCAATDDSTRRGALVAITFKSAVDDPGRFAKSRAVGAHFGLTQGSTSRPDRRDWRISRVGDAMVRAVLYGGAYHAEPGDRFSSLKRWATDVAKRRG
jgi:transposase